MKKSISLVVLVVACLMIVLLMSQRGSLTFTNRSGRRLERVSITIDGVDVQHARGVGPNAVLLSRFSAGKR